MNDNDDIIPAGVMTMVRGDLPWAARAEAVASQAEEAERRLAPVLQVMRETGLIEDGYRAALLEHMVVTWDLRDVPAASQERLAVARQLVRDRADLRGLPPAVIVFNHAVITVGGDPRAGKVAAWMLPGEGQGTALTGTGAGLAGDVDRVLSDAGLPAAPRLASGHPAGDGYAIEPMPRFGPACPVRVAVRWHHAAGGDPRPDLDLCRSALTTAGYRVEPITAAPVYLAVLPPPGS
jgi:hypothetical protein